MKIKKLILMLLIGFVGFNAFGSILTLDIQTCLQNILQRTQDYRQYIKQQTVWVEELKELYEQSKQIKEYFRQLMNLSESIAQGLVSGDLASVYNNAKNSFEILEKLKSQTKTTIENSKTVLKNVENSIIEFNERYLSLLSNSSEYDYEVLRTELDFPQIVLSRQGYLSYPSKEKYIYLVNKAIDCEKEKFGIFQKKNKEIETCLKDIISQIETVTKEISLLKEQKDSYQVVLEDYEEKYKILLNEDKSKLPDKAYEEILNIEKIIQNQISLCKDEIVKINSVINNYKNSYLNYLETLKTDFSEEKNSNTEELNKCNKNIEKYKSIIL